jgi:hypothetical protein
MPNIARSSVPIIFNRIDAWSCHLLGKNVCGGRHAGSPRSLALRDEWRPAITFGVITRRRNAGHLEIEADAKIDTVERYTVMTFGALEGE